MTLSEAIALFFAASYSEIAPSTARWYQAKLSTLPRYLDDAPVELISPTDLYHWRKCVFETPTIRGGLPARASCDGYILACRRFFNWLVEEGIIDESPARKLKRLKPDGKPPKAISMADFRRLCDLFVKEKQWRNLAIILFMLDTGCRLQTVNNIRLGDIDAGNLRAWTIEKGNKGRWLFLSGATMRAIDYYVYNARPDTVFDHVFISQRHTPLHPHTVQQVLKISARLAGCKGPTNPHSFRHAAAIEWLKRGMSLSSVSELLGHADIQTTHRFYARCETSQLQEQHDRFSPVPSLRIEVEK